MSKKWVFIAFLSLCVLLFAPQRQVSAQTLDQVRQQVDAELVNLWAIILQKQTMHHVLYGQFFQGLMTHNVIPGDGTRLHLDLQGANPSDQITNWIDFLEQDLPADLPMAITIDVYEGPRGSGFNATVYVCYQGVIYTRSKAIGPLAATLTQSWHIANITSYTC